MPLFRHWAQRLGKQAEALDGEGQLSALGAEGNSHDAQEISRVNPFFEKGVSLFSQHVKLETELHSVIFIFKCRKSRLAVAA